MVSLDSAATIPGAHPGILDKERIIAAAGFNRWLVPPAALCIHLCIGMAYGFSVFWLPLSRAIVAHTLPGSRTPVPQARSPRSTKQSTDPSSATT